MADLSQRRDGTYLNVWVVVYDWKPTEDNPKAGRFKFDYPIQLSYWDASGSWKAPQIDIHFKRFFLEAHMGEVWVDLKDYTKYVFFDQPDKAIDFIAKEINDNTCPTVEVKEEESMAAKKLKTIPPYKKIYLVTVTHPGGRTDQGRVESINETDPTELVWCEQQGSYRNDLGQEFHKELIPAMFDHFSIHPWDEAHVYHFFSSEARSREFIRMVKEDSQSKSSQKKKSEDHPGIFYTATLTPRGLVSAKPVPTADPNHYQDESLKCHNNVPATWYKVGSTNKFVIQAYIAGVIDRQHLENRRLEAKGLAPEGFILKLDGHEEKLLLDIQESGSILEEELPFLLSGAWTIEGITQAVKFLESAGLLQVDEKEVVIKKRVLSTKECTS